MKHALTSLIGGAVLAGFVTWSAAQTQQPPQDKPPVICNAGICRITVKVNDCGAKGGIDVDPLLMSMKRSGGHPRIIEWTIATPGYVFATPGVWFAPPVPDFQPLPSGQPNVVRMRNTLQTFGTHYYWLEVANCIPVDPFIRNDP